MSFGRTTLPNLSSLVSIRPPSIGIL
jgi:hypothetical protein